MQIGNNDGYVKKVTNNSIEVEESFRDDSGKVRKRIVKLTLLRKK
jgi:Tfp pilus assembly protein PilP